MADWARVGLDQSVTQTQTQHIHLLFNFFLKITGVVVVVVLSTLPFHLQTYPLHLQSVWLFQTKRDSSEGNMQGNHRVLPGWWYGGMHHSRSADGGPGMGVVWALRFPFTPHSHRDTRPCLYPAFSVFCIFKLAF